MSEILLAFDGSEYSAKALEKASSMAVGDDEIIVFYVMPAVLMKEFKDLDPAVSKTRAQEVVNEAVGTLKARGKRVTGVIHEGDVAEEIINFASKLKCSIIIIGSKGMSKIGRFSLGSVAEKVARHADRPVLIVR